MSQELVDQHGGVKLYRKKNKNDKLKIIPLGGLEQIGMNITAFEYKDDIIVVDCGLAFPEDEMLGIDLVIPDISYLKDNADKVRAIVLTHGHEDHIGSLPYVLKDLNVPIFGTKLTIGLVENKLKEHNLLKTVTRTAVTCGTVLDLGKYFKVEYIRNNHSIPDAASLAIRTPVGIIFHSGDFKIDYTPIYGEVCDLQRYASLGKEGVLLMLADSTNAERKGYTMSEKTVGEAFNNIFAKSEKNRIIIATFASNVDRVQQAINSAEKFNRKVVVEGRSMQNVVKTASDLGYLKIPDKMLIKVDELGNYEDNEVVIITTGSQGEPMAALSRMASNMHKKISIRTGDKVIFSSKPIPGNEKTVSRVVNELFRKGAEVSIDDAHVSGHACQEELKLLHSLIKPRYFMPVHGEYRHLMKHKELAIELGMKKEDVFVVLNGDIFEIDSRGGAISGHIDMQPVFVDGLGVGDVGNIVIKDRQKLSQDGLVIVIMTISKESGLLMSGPDIISRGFVYMRESEELIEWIRELVRKELDRCAQRHISDWGRIKGNVKDVVNNGLYERIKRSPMILPVIIEA